MANFAVLGVCLLQLALVSAELLQAQVLIRHGDRTPIHLLAGDDMSTWSIPQAGQLTHLGMRQCYAVGAKLRELYADQLFPKKTYDRFDIYARTSDIDRCHYSAQSLLRGFLEGMEPLPLGTDHPPQDEPLLTNGVKPAAKLPFDNYQPIPLHTVAAQHESLLRSFDVCPTYLEMFNRRMRQPDVEKLQAENAEFFQELSVLSGVKNISVSHFSAVADPVQVLDMQGLLDKAVPPNEDGSPRFSREVIEKVNDIADFAMAARFLGLPEMGRYAGGSLVHELLSNIEWATREQIDSMPEVHPVPFNHAREHSAKFSLYSAHDSTILALLAALQLPGLMQNIPPYASFFVVELHRSRDANSNFTFWVRASFNNQPVKLPCSAANTETDPALVGRCSLRQFLAWATPLQMGPQEWRTVCGPPPVPPVMDLKKPVPPGKLQRMKARAHEVDAKDERGEIEVNKQEQNAGEPKDVRPDADITSGNLHHRPLSADSDEAGAVVEPAGLEAEEENVRVPVGGSHRPLSSVDMDEETSDAVPPVQKRKSTRRPRRTEPTEPPTTAEALSTIVRELLVIAGIGAFAYLTVKTTVAARSGSGLISTLRTSLAKKH